MLYPVHVLDCLWVGLRQGEASFPTPGRVSAFPMGLTIIYLSSLKLIFSWSKSKHGKHALYSWSFNVLRNSRCMGLPQAATGEGFAGENSTSKQQNIPCFCNMALIQVSEFGA